MKKHVIALALTGALALSLTACGGSDSPADSAADAAGSGDLKVITVAASPTPHAEILEQVKPILEVQGYDLQIQEFTDYVFPNTVVDEGEVDANYFQHTPYLDQFNEENGTDIVSVGLVHYEPMGVYAGKTTSLDALPDGGTIAVPNDATNEARALNLIAEQGLITIDPAAGLKATPNDIIDNPKNLKFTEMEAALIPTTLEEFDLNVINSNYALQAELNPMEDALVYEDADSEFARTYANILAVKAGNEGDEGIQALLEALHSDKIRDFITETYEGGVLPVE